MIHPAYLIPAFAVLKRVSISNILCIYDSVLAEPDKLFRANLLALIVIDRPSKGQRAAKDSKTITNGYGFLVMAQVFEQWNFVLPTLASPKGTR